MSHGEVRSINGKRVASPEYRSWQMMKNRTLNPKAQDFKYYGGKGVRLARRWDDFDNFLADMGRKPTPLHTLERKPGCKHYKPGNCCWATRLEQARNRPGYLKMSLAKARQLRRYYATGHYAQDDLATHYGITQAHVSQIILGRVWKGGGQ